MQSRIASGHRVTSTDENFWDTRGMWLVTAPAFNGTFSRVFGVSVLIYTGGCAVWLPRTKYARIWNIKLTKNLTVTQDVEKAKPELWGTWGRLAVTGTTSMERAGGAAADLSPTLVI